MRKPRPDAKLMSLPEAAQAQIAEWLLSGLPYHAALAQIEQSFGVKTSMGALSSFWNDVCATALLARRRRAVTTADEIAQEATKMPGSFDEATIDALRQKAFELAVSPQADPKAVKDLFSLVLKSRSQDLEERRVTVMERKLEQAAQAEEVIKSEIPDEEKAARIKAIFGVK